MSSCCRCEASWASGRTVFSYPGGGNGKQRDMARPRRASDHPPPPPPRPPRGLLPSGASATGSPAAAAAGCWWCCCRRRLTPPAPGATKGMPSGLSSAPPPPESRGSGARIPLRARGIRGSNPTRPPRATATESGAAISLLVLSSVCSSPRRCFCCCFVAPASRRVGVGLRRRIGALHREEEREREERRQRRG